MLGFVRTCKICGEPLPADSAASRKYCIKCSKERSVEQQRERSERHHRKRTQERRQKAQIQEQKREKLMLSSADKKYCQKCIYVGSFSMQQLCNFMLIEGRRRGCKAGVGCTERKFPAQSQTRRKGICERCGAPFDNMNSRAHFCDKCRAEARYKNLAKARMALAANRTGGQSYGSGTE